MGKPSIFMTLCLLATMYTGAFSQDYDPKQGIRLEIGDGLALDNQNGTITFTPVNKKSMSQVWQVQKSAAEGFCVLVNPFNGSALDNGNHGNKVIYIRKRNDPAREYKIPYTIPYGKTMSRH